jgi:hypothetical protein
MAAENVDVAIGWQQLFLGPGKGRWLVRQVRASVVEKLQAAWVK